MKKTFQIVLIGLLAVASAAAQPPKRELRAVWLTTVWRSDWPPKVIPSQLSAESVREKARVEQKDAMISILDRLQEANFNTVYFQVRSMCDAMYKSSYEPWSQWLVASRGEDPGYDPLEFVIEEAHKRGMELHVWVNPYRYSTGASTHGNLSTDYPNTHSEWLLDYGKSEKRLNPGVPEARRRVVDVVAEIVEKYDVDGILFDDYFYVSNKTTNAMDKDQYEAYNTDPGLSQADWRRQNVNTMVAEVQAKIKSIKPYAVFGIGPAGVASSDPTVAAGHGVRPSPGSDWQYSGIFSDPVAWVKAGTVDYISPQLYWAVVKGAPNDYLNLAAWWSEVAEKFGRHFYSSNDLEDMTGADTKSIRISGEDEEVELEGLTQVEQAALRRKQVVSTRAVQADGFTFSEIGRQVAHNRNTERNGATGYVLFATDGTVNTTGFIEYLRDNVAPYPALPPAFTWFPAEAHGFVENIAVSGGKLSWTYPKNDVRYAVYAVPNGNRNDGNVFGNPKYLLGVSYSKQYTLPQGVSAGTHTFGVAVWDRSKNEYPVRVMGEPLSAPEAARLVFPADEEEVVFPVQLRWQPVADATLYTLEIARDEQFTDLVHARELEDTTFFTGSKCSFVDELVYYWRVRTRKANTLSEVYSETGRFSGTQFKILSPANGDTDVPLLPTISWMEMAPDASYTLEVSSASGFQAKDIVYSQTGTATEQTLPAKALILGTDYLARIKVEYKGFTIYSTVVQFTVEKGELRTPEIISPLDGAVIGGTELNVVWKEVLASGFKAEISQDNTFPSRETKVEPAGAYEYQANFKKLKAGTWYIRVRTAGPAGISEPSELVSVQLTGASGNVDLQTDSSFFTYYDAAGQVHVVLASGKEGDVDLSIYSLSGMLLQQETYRLQTGKNVFTPDMASSPSGLYVLKVEMDGGVRSVLINH